MSSRFATLLCLMTIFIVGMIIFWNNPNLDYYTILFALKTIIPAGLVTYLGGYYIGKILETSNVDTDIIKIDSQKLFIDDLLLTPDEVVNNISKAETVNSQESLNNKDNNANKQEKSNEPQPNAQAKKQ